MQSSLQNQYRLLGEMGGSYHSSCQIRVARDSDPADLDSLLLSLYLPRSLFQQSGKSWHILNLHSAQRCELSPQGMFVM